MLGAPAQVAGPCSGAQALQDAVVGWLRCGHEVAARPKAEGGVSALSGGCACPIRRKVGEKPCTGRGGGRTTRAHSVPLGVQSAPR
jgi:hypothetical protein